MNSKIAYTTLVLVLLTSHLAVSQNLDSNSPVFKQEELEQIVAPIALYPDSLTSQILMASTYPLDVVKADKWVSQNKNLKADALTEALEKETWDPSIKSLVNFPQVLKMMSEKLDWTQKLGDAFLAQQEDVLNAIQKLRSKAQDQGSLKTTEQQVVKTEEQTIIIESADPQVIYVPTYDPTVVYGAWPYSNYPPYSYYYDPGYVAGSNLLSFGLGVGIGAAWGYAWGDCDWHGGDIDIDYNRNFNANTNIDRSKYAQQYRNNGQLAGKGKWQHNPQNRKGVAYRDQATAQRYNRASSAETVKSREAYRGRAEQGRQQIARGDTDRFKGQQPSRTGSAASRDLSSRSPQSTAQRGGTAASRSRTSQTRPQTSSSMGASAFSDINRGSSARNYSSRGQASRQSMSRPSGGGMRGGGGRGGGGRGGRR